MTEVWYVVGPKTIGMQFTAIKLTPVLGIICPQALVLSFPLGK